MTAERHGKWDYYRCSRQTYKKERCRARFSNATRAHADLKRLCLQIQMNRSTAEAIRSAAHQEIERRAATVDERMTGLRQEHRELLTQEVHLTEAFANGDLTPERYRTTSDGLRHRRADIEGHLSREPLPAAQLRQRVGKALELATSVWDLYGPLDDARRTDLLKAVFKTIVLGPEGILGFSLRAPLDTLHDGNHPGRQAASLVEALEAT
jgi:hypothetical protein